MSKIPAAAREYGLEHLSPEVLRQHHTLLINTCIFQYDKDTPLEVKEELHVLSVALTRHCEEWVNKQLAWMGLKPLERRDVTVGIKDQGKGPEEVVMRDSGWQPLEAGR